MGGSGDGRTGSVLARREGTDGGRWPLLVSLALVVKLSVATCVRVGLLWAALAGPAVRVCPRRRRLLGVRMFVLGGLLAGALLGPVGLRRQASRSLRPGTSPAFPK